MTKQVQIVGSNRESQDAYVGPPREITVDTSNRGLRVHDGVKPGGHSILNRDDNDSRYQAKSDELNGLIGFEPQEHGIIFRLGAAHYRVGQIEADPDSMVVTDGNGFAGNPTIALANDIAGDRGFSGVITFVERTIFADGLTGDTYGDHTGDSFGLHTGDVVGDVTGDAHGDHSGTFTGDADFTGHSVFFDSEQIPNTAVAGLPALIAAQGVAAGIIAMWSGSLPMIPAGWVLCDGDNGTPDLSNFFVIGASVDRLPGQTGGSTTHTHTGETADAGGHTHGGTTASHILTESEIPAHSHGNGLGLSTDDIAAAAHGTMPLAWPSSISLGVANTAIAEAVSKQSGGGGGHSHGLNMESGGVHKHGFTANASSHMPPWFALAYIMKL